MAADLRGDPSCRSTLSERPPSVPLVYQFFGEHRAALAATGAEQPALAILCKAGGINVGPERLRPARGGKAWCSVCRPSLAAVLTTRRRLAADPRPSF
jgi:hypothetical protein